MFALDFTIKFLESSSSFFKYFLLLFKGDSTLKIAWDVIDCAFMNDVVMPSDDERIHTDYMNKNYAGKIITPWYRILPQRVSCGFVNGILNNR